MNLSHEERKRFRSFIEDMLDGMESGLLDGVADLTGHDEIADRAKKAAYTKIALTQVRNQINEHFETQDLNPSTTEE